MATDAPLDADRLDHFRRKLVDARNALARRIGDSQRVVADAPIEPGDDDNAAGGEVVDDALTFGSRFTLEQHEIDDALLRIERGEYGVCEECGNPIEPERLEVQPAARLCADDARRADRRDSPSL
jgi:DnaK suppressor protein